MPNGDCVTNENINGIIRSVCEMTDDEQEQLSILANAFVVVCKSIGISKNHAAANIKTMFTHDHFTAPVEH